MARQLTVVNCPSQDLARTNCGYVSRTDPLIQANVKYAEVNSWVLSIDSDPAVAANGLGLNAIQRKGLRVSTGDPINVRPFEIPRAGFEIALFNAEVDFTAKRNPKAPPLELEATELSARLLRLFEGQVFTRDQILTFEYQGINFILKVSGLLVVAGGREDPDAHRGLLVPSTSFVFETQSGAGITIKGQRGIVAPQLFKHKEFNFEKLGIGGLDIQFEQIFRRAFASRVFPPAIVERLGIHHVKGVLLHGPPGTGKTLIARQIGKMLNGKEPKIVNGPEVLNKYVGASEENIRNLFKDAEAEQLARGEASDLHVIIFDEIDAICKSRGSVRDGSGVHDTIVNQLLTKIDGVDALNNILLIGMTNRKDMLDEALLRPGRLEVQVEIGLPDESGRLQILKIHTGRMQTNSFLAADVDLWALSQQTKNFSGAELEGLVKSATSFALNRNVDVADLSKPIDEENLKVTMADFLAALAEVKPAFGAVVDTLETYRLNGMIDSGVSYRHLRSTCNTLVQQVRTSEHTPLLTCLLEGPPGAGKTALAATVGLESEYPFVKIISSDNMVGYSEQAKANQIAKVFEDAYRSPLSLIILDDIERLLEYVPIGPRFSNVVLQVLLVLLKRVPPEGRKLLILGTSSSAAVMDDMGIAAAFNVVLHVPKLHEEEIRMVLVTLDAFAPSEVDAAVASLVDPDISIKRLLLLLEMARQGAEAGARIPVLHWNQVLKDLAP